MSFLTYNTIVVMCGTSLLGAVSGLVGSFAVLRRRALTGDALAHSALPGLCIAFFVLQEKSLGWMLFGAFVSGVIGICIVAGLRRLTRIKEDAAIGIVLSTFYGLGIVLLAIIQRKTTTGSQAGLKSFILGKTAGMLFNDVLLIGGVALLCLILVSLLFKEFKVIAFDPDFAGTQGWPVMALDLLLMMMIALTVVIGLPAVGVVLISALLITPAAAARFWTDQLGRMLVISGVMGLLIGAIGTLISAKSTLFLSDRFPLPAGAVIVLVAAMFFVVSLFFAPKRGVFAMWKIRSQFREQLEYQRLLREMYTATEAGTHPVAFVELLNRRSWSEDELQTTVRELRSEGLIKAGPHDRLALTDSGLHQAAVVTRGYRLWKLYMMRHAEIAGNFLDLDAESIDRIVAPETISKLESILNEQGRLPVIPRPGGSS
jgi:manganese/zinc/iron transport system permease protein